MGEKVGVYRRGDYWSGPRTKFILPSAWQFLCIEGSDVAAIEARMKITNSEYLYVPFGLFGCFCSYLPGDYTQEFVDKNYNTECMSLTSYHTEARLAEERAYEKELQTTLESKV